MIETCDIYNTINELLELEFPDIPIQNIDKNTSMLPRFCIKCLVSTTTQTAIEYDKTDFTFNIIYYAEASNIEDLIAIEKKLKSLFKKPLKINFTDDRNPQYQEIERITTTLNNETSQLNCSLKFSIDQLNSEEEGITDFIDRYDEFNNEEHIEELEI